MGGDNMEQKQEIVLGELMSQPENKVCADCGATGPRWASVNLGVFLCMTCSSLHRKLGVHISQVRSCTLDRWTEEQLERIKNMGNAKAKQLYEANLPRGFRRPSSEELDVLERWIRDKYERKLFMRQEDKSRLEAQSGSSNHRMRSSLREDIYVPNRQWSDRDFSSPALRVLLEMGFRRDDAITALGKSRGDIMQAVDWILIHGSASQPAHRPSPPLQQPKHSALVEDLLIEQQNLESQSTNTEYTNNSNESKLNNIEEDNDDNFANFEDEFEEFVSADQVCNSSQEHSYQREEIRNKILDLYKQIAVQPTTKDSPHYLFQDNNNIWNDLDSHQSGKTTISTNSTWATTTSPMNEQTTFEEYPPKKEDSKTKPDPFEDLLSLSSALPPKDSIRKPILDNNNNHNNNVDDDDTFQGFDA